MYHIEGFMIFAHPKYSCMCLYSTLPMCTRYSLLARVYKNPKPRHKSRTAVANQDHI